MLAEQLAKTGEAAKSGPIGLAVILLLCVACYFLFKSMSRHLRKVREDFPEAPASSEPVGTTDATGGTEPAQASEPAPHAEKPPD